MILAEKCTSDEIHKLESSKNLENNSLLLLPSSEIRPISSSQIQRVSSKLHHDDSLSEIPGLNIDDKTVSGYLISSDENDSQDYKVMPVNSFTEDRRPYALGSRTAG
jgi:hypothetical protein